MGLFTRLNRTNWTSPNFSSRLVWGNRKRMKIYKIIWADPWLRFQGYVNPLKAFLLWVIQNLTENNELNVQLYTCEIILLCYDLQSSSTWDAKLSAKWAEAKQRIAIKIKTAVVLERYTMIRKGTMKSGKGWSDSSRSCVLHMSIEVKLLLRQVAPPMISRPMEMQNHKRKSIPVTLMRMLTSGIVERTYDGAEFAEIVGAWKGSWFCHKHLHQLGLRCHLLSPKPDCMDALAVHCWKYMMEQFSNES